MDEQKPTIFETFDRNLYRLGVVVYSSYDGEVLNSSSSIPPDSIGSGSSSSTVQQTNGSTAANKTSFSDTKAGYILGFDTDGIAKFLIGDATSSLYWNGSSLAVVGSITATSGTIGGFTIGTEYIRDTANSFGLSSNVSAGDDVRFWAGSAFVDRDTAPFKITEAGVITATSGTIGGCVLSASSLSSTSFVSGPLGSGWRIQSTGDVEFQNATIRGTIRTSVFEKDTMSCVNGLVLISKADVLASDMTALDASTVTIAGETSFVANEVIRIKDGTDDEWMLVTNAASAPTYTVTRDLAGSYTANTNPVWKKGTAVVSMGVGTGTKTGFILFDSSSANSPFIDIYGRNSNTYSDYTLHARMGWLKGIVDADVGLSSTDVWGLYTDNAYIKGTIVASAGKITGTLDVTGSLVIGSAGLMRSGQTAYDTGTGFWMGDDSGTTKFSLGNSSGNKLTWDGTTLNIVGIQNVAVSKVAKETMAIGTPVGYTNVSGEVARAVRMVGSSATTPPTFANNLVVLDVISVDTNKYIMLYNDVPGSYYIRVVAFSVDSTTNDITFGSSVTISSDAGNIAGICKLDTNKFAVCFEYEPNHTGYVSISTVSSLTITEQSSTQISAGAGNYTKAQCCALDTDKFAWAFFTADTTYDEVGFCTVSTYTPTVVDYEQNTFSNNEIQCHNLQMTKVATDKFAMINGYSGYLTVCTTGSSTFTKGTGVNIITASSTISTTPIDVSLFSIVDNTFWIRAGIYLAYGTISTTTPTEVDTTTVANLVCADLFTDGSSLYEIFSSATSASSGIYALSCPVATIIRTQIFSFNMTGTYGIRVGVDGTNYVATTGIQSTSTAYYHIKGMSPGFIGFTHSAVDKGNSVLVAVTGLDANQSGRTPGGFYEVINGGLTLTVDPLKAWKVQAESATTVRI